MPSSLKFAVSALVTDQGIRPDVLARAVEERGFDALFIAEHSHVPSGSAGPNGAPMPPSYYRSLDPFIALTAAAAVTERLLLGTGVALLPQRDVIHTAKEVATLDLLSGGRVLLAVGVGWNLDEVRNHGVDPGSRGARMDEQLAALKLIWTRQEASFHGEHVRFGPLQQWPKPVQRPHPPIYIGGQSAAARRRVAEHGDGWFPNVLTPEELRAERAVLAERGRTDVVLNVPGKLELLDEFAEAGAHRAVFHFDQQSESDMLRELDTLAAALAG